jgi:hypothetical protein
MSEEKLKIPLQERIKTLERLVLFGIILLSTYYQLVIIGGLSYYPLIFSMILFFISLYVTLFYFVKLSFIVGEGISSDFARVVNYIYEKTKSWNAYIIYTSILVVAVLIIRYGTGNDWNDIIASSLIGILILLIGNYRVIIRKLKLFGTNKQSNNEKIS